MSAWVRGARYGFSGKYALVSLLPLAPLPPVSALSPLKVEQFSWELRHHPNP